MQLESRVKPLEDLSFRPEDATRHIKVLKRFITDTGKGNLSTLQEAKQKSEEAKQKSDESIRSQAQVLQKACRMHAWQSFKSTVLLL